MDLGYTEFQELLRQTARDFAQRDFPISKHRELVDNGRTFDAETWRKMADIGWLGLMVQERYGGTQGGWVDLMVLLEEMGKALIPCTYMSHTLAGVLIQEHGSQAQKDKLLPAFAQGERIMAVAITEPRATYDRDGIRCQATHTAKGYTLQGTKHFVRGAEAADTIIVLGRLDDKLGLFLLEKSSPGVEVQALGNIGDDDQGKVGLTNVEVPEDALLGGAALDWEALGRIVEMGALVECGYGTGMMARDAEMTVEYVKDRVQFGRPIGAFQAVRQQVADQATDLDAARYLTLYAAWALDEGRTDAAVAIARAKAWVSDALRRVTRTGNQLHGAMGFSREYDLHFYFQRAKTSELMFGLADVHRERVAAALLDG